MRNLLLTALIACAPVIAPSVATAQGTPAPEDARVYFVEPADGETVSNPVTVRFGIEGMELAPAGTDAEMTGHHHLLIDRLPFGEGVYGEEELELAIPNDDNHLHFGGAQTEVSLELAPGPHTLQLVLGDSGHVPHDPPVASEVITINVQ